MIEILKKKLQKEEDAFEVYVMMQPTECILNFAYEVAVKRDIVEAVDTLWINDKQCAALIEMDNALQTIYDEYMELDTDYMDNIRESIEVLANKVITAGHFHKN